MSFVIEATLQKELEQTDGTPCMLLTIHIPTLSSGVWTKLADTWTEAWRCGPPTRHVDTDER